MIFIDLTGCPAYQYGVNCQLTCGHCEKDETCDPVTGVCVNGCVPGFTGVECKQGLFPMTCHCLYKKKINGKCILRKTIEGYLDSVPSLTFNTLI